MMNTMKMMNKSSFLVFYPYTKALDVYNRLGGKKWKKVIQIMD